MRGPGVEVHITPVPILGITPCCIPVVPGSSEVEAPIAERSELCAVDAHWIVGMAPTCDTHMRHLCKMVDWSWPELVADAGRTLDDADRPWSTRDRHSQVAAREAEEHFKTQEPEDD